MGFYRRRWMLLYCLLLACFCFSGCSQSSNTEKTGRVIVLESEYNIRQTHENSYVLDVRGKVKNVGDVDVKKVVVTGYCRSCILEFTGHRWFTSDVDKTPTQKDIISYLAVGAEAEFSFEEVAFFFTHAKVPPENIPEEIEVVVESFDAVN